MALPIEIQARSARSLVQWFQTPAGLEQLQGENALLSSVLPGLFGYHLLSFGEMVYEGLSASPIVHRAHVLPGQEGETTVEHDLLGYYTNLPIISDSVDVVVLPHVLEYSPHPHAVLREMERILHPDGHIVIIGFNPISCYGLCRGLLAYGKNKPWVGHYYHPLRIRDWLQLLGFGIKKVDYSAFLPPIQHRGIANRLNFLEKAGNGWLAPLSGVYMIVARNLTITPNVIKPKWEKNKPVLDGVVEPTTRVGSSRMMKRKNNE